MLGFLALGRPVYAEGADFPYFNQGNTLWPAFGASYGARGNPSGNVTAINGQAGTFAQGFTMSYPPGGPNMYNNSMSSAGGTEFLLDQSSVPRGIYHTYEFARTMVSSVIFGALGPADRRQELLQAYMDHLLYGLGTDEAGVAVPGARLAASPVACGATVRLAVPDGISRVTVFDRSGRQVAMLDARGRSRVDWTAAGRPGVYLVRAGAAAQSVVVTR